MTCVSLKDIYNENHSHINLDFLAMDTLIFPHTPIRNLHQSDIPDFKISIDSDTLFKNGDVIFILHKGEQYSLRRTRNGKLILNK